MSAWTPASELLARLRWRDQRGAFVYSVDALDMLRGNHVVLQVNENFCSKGLFFRQLRPVKREGDDSRRWRFSQ